MRYVFTGCLSIAQETSRLGHRSQGEVKRTRSSFYRYCTNIYLLVLFVYSGLRFSYKWYAHGQDYQTYFTSCSSQITITALRQTSDFICHFREHRIRKAQRKLSNCSGWGVIEVNCVSLMYKRLRLIRVGDSKYISTT